MMHRLTRYLFRRGEKKFGWLMISLILISAACILPSLPSDATQTLTKPAVSATPMLTPTTVAPFPAALLEVWPVDGSTLAYRQPIIIYFNQAMQKESVEKNLVFSPVITGKMEWLDDSTLKFIPNEVFPFNIDLTVNLSGKVLSENAQNLMGDVSLTYHTAGAPAVSERLPQPGTLDVDPSMPLVVNFNQAIVPLTETESAGEAPAFTLEPAAEGRGEWLNSSTYIFYPSPPLKGGSVYHINLRPDLSFAGDENVDWRFSTAMPGVLSVDPEVLSPLPLDGVIQILFNQPMDRQSVEQNLSLTATTDQKPVPGGFKWNDEKNRLTFTPDTLLVRDTAYRLNISSGARAANGDYLPQALTYVYQSVSSLSLVSTQPDEGGVLENGGSYSGITLKYNVALDEHQNLSSLISFDPPAGDLSTYINQDHELILSALLKPDTNYILRISTDLKDRWGGNLTVSPDMHFKTAPAKPGVYVPMLQFTRTLFMRPQDVNLETQVTNLSSLVVRSQPIDLQDYINLEKNEDGLRSYKLNNPENWLLHYNRTAQSRAEKIQLTPGGGPLEPGLYYFRLASKEMTSAGIDDVYFMASVSHIQLTLKRSLKEMLVWAVDLDNNQPVVQKALLLYDQDGKAVARCTTDVKGVCIFDLPTLPDEVSNRYFAVMGKQGDADFSLALDSWDMGTSGYNFGINNLQESSRPYVYL
ncbi:MAG: Ig-like domain-containing protein, partial [Anaerolineae bacterium]|nr:Ig-like domain-containing protein [Anaerolineae bacterium]